MASKAILPSAASGEIHPFDAAAAGYDASFTNTLLGRWYRTMVWERLERLFDAGDHVLELGCGTGEDAIWLANRGVRVTATDPAHAMLDTAINKARASGADALISFSRLDVNTDIEIAHLASEVRPGDVFDGALANFGPLNCVEDRRTLARRLAEVVRPGGYLVLTIMGPLCPWETLWHMARLEFGTAFRRHRSGGQARVADDGALPVWYPSPRRVETEFSPYFRTVERLGLGLLLPPSGMARLVDRFPRFFRVPAAIDRRCARLRPWLWLNDHYLLVMERES